MSRKSKGFTQGELDGLCGLYAIVNAVSFVTGQSTPKTRLLWDYLCKDLLEFKPEAVMDGLYGTQMRRLIRAAQDHLSDGYVKFNYGFSRNKFASVSDFAGTLSEKIEGGGCAIVGFGEPWNHWTVITAVTPRSFALVDSGSPQTFRVRLSGLSISDTPGKTSLHYRTTIIVRRA